MFFTPEDTRRRYAIIESSQFELVENLALPRVVEALGQSTVDAILEGNDQLYIPNIHNGELIIPRRYRNKNKIPVIAIDPGEEVHMSESVLIQTPAQKSQVNGYFQIAWERDNPLSKELVEEILPSKNPRIVSDETRRIHLNENLLGRVAVPQMYIDLSDAESLPAGNQKFVLFGRPVMAICTENRGYSMDSLFLHELIHVNQFRSKGITSYVKNEYYKDSINQELEAYHYHNAYDESVFDPSLDFWQSLIANRRRFLANMIELVRSSCADPDRPFEVNKEIYEELKFMNISWLPENVEF